MTCKCCNVARETFGHHTWYDSLKCLFCAARLIQRIGSMQIAKSEASTRMRAVLLDSVGNGHSETEIRSMVKVGPYLAPLADKKKG